MSQLPIKKLKIDRSFVSQIGTNTESEAIIKTIITLAKSLDLKSIAEGIETQQQFDFLKDAGAMDGQGYWLSKPLPLTEINALIKTNLNALISEEKLKQ